MHGTFGTSLATMVHRLVIGLVALATLTIPVECAASDGPHSVFLSPSEAGVSREGGSSHDHVAPATNSHRHDSGTAHNGSGRQSEVATDADSQRGMAGFDVPFTINKPSENVVERANIDSLSRLARHEHISALVVVAPEPPPPR